MQNKVHPLPCWQCSLDRGPPLVKDPNQDDVIFPSIWLLTSNQKRYTYQVLLLSFQRFDYKSLFSIIWLLTWPLIKIDTHVCMSVQCFDCKSVITNGSSGLLSLMSVYWSCNYLRLDSRTNKDDISLESGFLLLAGGWEVAIHSVLNWKKKNGVEFVYFHELCYINLEWYWVCIIDTCFVLAFLWPSESEHLFLFHSANDNDVKSSSCWSE